MNCLYCSKKVQEVIEYPYPYVRVAINDKKSLKIEEVQFIQKFVCECGYPTFTDKRKTNDGQWIYQDYKQGLYILYPNMR